MCGALKPESLKGRENESRQSAGVSVHRHTAKLSSKTAHRTRGKSKERGSCRGPANVSAHMHTAKLSGKTAQREEEEKGFGRGLANVSVHMHTCTQPSSAAGLHKEKRKNAPEEGR